MGLTRSENALFGKDGLGAVPPWGGRLCVRSLSLFQEMHAFVALHSGFSACETEFRQQKKLRTVTGAVICRKDLALIHDRDMLRHKAKGERRARGPMSSGSCNLDAVSNSSANAALSQA